MVDPVDVAERGKTIATRYGNQDGKRQVSLDRGRAVSALTIPQILPAQGHNEHSELLTPYNDMGARVVNNLANKLFLTLFPVSTPFFQFKVSEAVTNELVAMGQTQAKQEIEQKLRQQEQIVQSDMEVSGMRPALYEVMRHLVIAGDVLLNIPKEGAPNVYHIDQYVVKRSRSGRVLNIILKQRLHKTELKEAWLELLDDSDVPQESNTEKEDESYDVYTEVWFKDNMYYEQSFLNGKPMDGTSGQYKEDENAWLAIRWSGESGEDYGRSYGYEYYGLFKALEGYHKALREHSAIASKTLGLLSRSSRLSIKDIISAPNGTVLHGEEGELTFPEVGKYNDMRVAEQMVQRYSESLAKAFLVVQTRDAERVTAEEIRLMANELETALGGAYSLLSKTLQEPLLKREIARLRATDDLVDFGREDIEPKVIVGLEGLGKGSDLEKLRRISALALEVGQSAQFIPNLNVEGTVKSMFNWEGLDPAGILYTEEEVKNQQAQAQAQQQEQFQQEQQAQMAQQVVPEAMKGMMATDGFKEDPMGSIQNAQQQIQG
jgi:hypothetical protein